MSSVEKEFDKLGRIVIPAEFRKRLGIELGAQVLISLCEDHIRISPTENRCALCGKRENYNKNLRLCNDCINAVKQYPAI